MEDNKRKVGRPRLDLTDKEKMERYELLKNSANNRNKREKLKIKEKYKIHLEKLQNVFTNSKMKTTASGITLMIVPEDFDKLYDTKSFLVNT